MVESSHEVATVQQKTDIDFLREWLVENTQPGRCYALILHNSYSRWMQKRQLEPLALYDFAYGLRLLNVDRIRDRRGSLISLALKPHPARLEKESHQRTRQSRRLSKLFR